ncbi:TatD family hydrolase [Gleimia sp. 6138-11-ORH1]|uniref:TatD family hydrolase n=1 Tax=Gleimia sp. 6138-11-ORH1 TaxID=2973937 RepID=UPI002169381A|nr:TatD family hydrolase [Gleimia sp. 6138-11-ORH1]MCS4483943.1 TatD family hydrolase [Gleimia sp. 6138-11-ORH1]
MSKKKRTWPETPQPLPLPVMDNHTHLPLGEWEIPSADGIKLPLNQQLERAKAAGINRIITVACEINDFTGALKLTEEYNQDDLRIRAALALHPNEAPLHCGYNEPSPDGLIPKIGPQHCPLDEALNYLETQITHPGVVAVGETGLDMYRTARGGLKAQIESFHAHLEIAHRHNLPVQIHDRETHAECVSVLHDAKPSVPIVFHCFSGGTELAAECAKQGWYASFGGPLTYPANQELREAFLALPKELIVVETDAPYLTPVPHRGSPNASYVMAHTVRFIAELWEIDESAAIAQLNRNAQQIYGTW